MHMQTDRLLDGKKNAASVFMLARNRPGVFTKRDLREQPLLSCLQTVQMYFKTQTKQNSNLFRIKPPSVD